MGVLGWQLRMLCVGGATALMIASLQPKGKWDSWIYVPAILIGTSLRLCSPHPLRFLPTAQALSDNVGRAPF